ncbi:MAG: dTMP kinase [Alphaproteobacteria bacterium]|nr:dTMP kinase [Alphaproteobacteria bacterium]
MTGRFLSFEGGEGTGKSTQLRLLADALRDGGLDVVTTREPGGSPGAEQIRRLLVEGEPGRWDGMTEALLHYAARRDHLRATVHPALGRGAWVLTDRFADSTLAYQGWGHGLDRALLERLDALAIGGFRPDLTLVLDLPAIQGLARAAGRGGAEDRYERMDVTFHERLREGFLDIARREPGRCAVIDAAGDPDQVHAAVLTVVRERLGQFLASA